MDSLCPSPDSASIFHGLTGFGMEVRIEKFWCLICAKLARSWVSQRPVQLRRLVGGG
jgi:hypothetical protein